MRQNVMAWRQQSSRRSKLKHIIHKRTAKIQLLHGRVGAQRLRNRFGSFQSDLVICRSESVQEFRRGQEEMRPNAMTSRQQSSRGSKLNTSSTNARRRSSCFTVVLVLNACAIALAPSGPILLSVGVNHFRSFGEERRDEIKCNGVETQSSRRRKLKCIIHKRTTEIQLLHRRVGAHRLRNRRGSSITNELVWETMGRERGQNTAKPINSCLSEGTNAQDRYTDVAPCRIVLTASEDRFGKDG